MRGVHRHTQDAAIGAQLLVGGDPVGVERDQAQRRSAVLGGEGCCELGRAGGLAHAGGADQRKHTPVVFDRQTLLVGEQVVFEHAAGPCH